MALHSLGRVIIQSAGIAADRAEIPSVSSIAYHTRTFGGGHDGDLALDWFSMWWSLLACADRQVSIEQTASCRHTWQILGKRFPKSSPIHGSEFKSTPPLKWRINL